MISMLYGSPLEHVLDLGRSCVNTSGVYWDVSIPTGTAVPLSKATKLIQKAVYLLLRLEPVIDWIATLKIPLQCPE